MEKMVEEMRAKYEAEIEALQETAEMATVEKEIAEEKLDACQRELQHTKDLLVDAINSKQQEDVSGLLNESTVTVYQLQKVEEQNEVLKQALIKLRDISARDKKYLNDLNLEHDQLLEKCLELEDKEQKYLEKIKIYEEQIDVSSTAHEMVEKLSHEKEELEEKLRELRDDLDGMEKLSEINEQILETARANEVELSGENDLLRAQLSELIKKKKDVEDYMVDQERNLTKIREDNRQLSEQLAILRGQCDQSESLEQQKHQIENVAYKLNFNETKMAEKEAEIARYRRNLAAMEEQMNGMSQMTKVQATQIDELKLNNESQQNKINELRRLLKKETDEVDELKIRKEMAEKKLSSLQQETEKKLASLTKKLEQMEGREVEYEEALKRQEEDIDNMEQERRDLRDQLMRGTRSQLGERTTSQSANVTMMTAQDLSFNQSLNLSIQNQSSLSQQQQQTLEASPRKTSSSQQQLDSQQQSTPLNVYQTPSSVFDEPSFSAPPVDESILEARIRDLRKALVHVNRRNFELEVELAAKDLNMKPPPYIQPNQAATSVDVQLKSLDERATKLRREARLAMINKVIPTKSRLVESYQRKLKFEDSKLAFKYQSLENEAISLFHSSSLIRPMPVL